jgi:acylphosphatase
MMKHVTIRVSGKVQGVFFRASTEKEAQKLKLSGIVRNELDGSVYIEAEGNETAIEQLIVWCRKGPERARVDKCEVTEGQPKGYTEFRIER